MDTVVRLLRCVEMLCYLALQLRSWNDRNVSETTTSQHVCGKKPICCTADRMVNSFRVVEVQAYVAGATGRMAWILTKSITVNLNGSISVSVKRYVKCIGSSEMICFDLQINIFSGTRKGKASDDPRPYWIVK